MKAKLKPQNKATNNNRQPKKSLTRYPSLAATIVYGFSPVFLLHDPTRVRRISDEFFNEE